MLTILALVAGVAVAVIRPGGEAAALRSAVNGLVNALRRAQAEAIADNRQTIVTLDLDERRYFVADRTLSGAFPQQTKLVFRTAASEYVGGNRASVRFFPDGTSTGGQITVERQGQSWLVRINWISGHIAAERTDQRP